MGLTALGLSSAHERVYLRALRDPLGDPTVGEDDGATVLGELRELGLVGGPDGNRANPPSVLEELADQVADELARRQRDVARTRAEIAALAYAVHARGADAAPEAEIELIEDAAQVRERIDELSFFARTGILSLQPMHRPRSAPATSREDRRSVRRGLRLRVVVDRPVSSMEGTSVRVARARLHRVIVIDDEVAVIATGSGRAGALIVRQPGLFSVVRAHAELLWDGAVGPTPARPGADELRLLELLQTGATDDSLGRTLGISDRQVRRRVTRLLSTLDVPSRFAAGVEATRRGWL